MKSPFDFDISAAKDKKRRNTRSRRASSGEFETSSRICDKSGCEEAGKFRAPKSPTSTDDYLWFCLEHVREYNAQWNFFSNDEDVDAQIERDKLGERPTRPMMSDEAKAWARMGVADPYELLRDKATSRRNAQSINASRFTANERKALEALGMEGVPTKSEVRKRFKLLVKDLHPDSNDGSRADEDRLNEVVWAWDQLKDSRNFPSK